MKNLSHLRKMMFGMLSQNQREEKLWLADGYIKLKEMLKEKSNNIKHG